MDRPLVVTDPSDRAPELIQEAGELAADADVPLHVLTVVSDEEFQNDAEVIDSIADVEGGSYNTTAEEYAESVANSAITDLLSNLDIETEAIGRAVEGDSERADTILSVAEDNDCDYIFLVGQRRRPTGKAVFGDTAQRVILNSDQYVVTLTE
ncbi:Nucleotide-binding universal stress protein, UspA family [Natronoarchaeum philippinense]|uniref:Nucleotide-binding universal stress protein, UspA family n=1 Tax=Natronoarchaeum philippinense TaxID=558529 RepID=A0A285P5U2_NATPI|nr:universal stress protein [Natronoarchaeum philippinense]SNZ17094.1 Nucleotide-binding universal stress protein, UspA family [Natronoarchaeum philippinense]